MPFELLNCAFVFLRRSLAVERAEIFSFARSRIFLAGIQPIFAGFQFPNHNEPMMTEAMAVVRTAPAATSFASRTKG
jgi:hypothetical protein